MSNKKNFIKYNKIIDQIELIRSKNNGNWMEILRIAFQYSPKETAKVVLLGKKRFSTLQRKTRGLNASVKTAAIFIT